MNSLRTYREFIEDVLNINKFAVLATEGDDQPHASLIAITPLRSCRQLVFATYRNTLKYRNITHNSKVAVLIDSGDINNRCLHESKVLTIIGYTEEISISENEAIYQAHLKWHPELESFMLSPDCALILVIAQSYQVVNGIDDIRWIKAGDLGTTRLGKEKQ
jgi:general stress protein 26